MTRQVDEADDPRLSRLLVVMDFDGSDRKKSRSYGKFEVKQNSASEGPR